ncbi:MAG: MFS transporter, partial [Methanocorpusculum sp.]|nr:MFS transporter [Methanocorpusculum sp.]
GCGERADVWYGDCAGYLGVVMVELRGTAIGIAMTGVFLGQLVGPLLAGALMDVYGWQMVYLILVLLLCCRLYSGCSVCAARCTDGQDVV